MPCGGGGIGAGGALIMSTSMAATEPNRVGDESLLRPLLRTVPAAGEREVVEQAEEKKRGETGVATNKCSRCLPQRLSGMGRAWFWLPCRQFQQTKGLCLGKGACREGSGRRVGGEQGARFAGRRRAAFGIRWGFAAAGAGQTENRLQTLGSGRVEKKGRRSTSAFSLPSTCFKGRQTTSERRRGGRRNAQPDEVRGRTTDQKEKRQAAGGQALHDFTPGKPHVIVIQILCSVITITSPTIHPLRTRYTALVRTA